MDIEALIPSAEPTAEDKAREVERVRRLSMIAAEMNPDTGAPLTRTDRHAMRGLTEQLEFEQWVFLDNRRRDAEGLFADLQKRFENNPIWAWEAIAVAESYVVEMPKWVVDYLAEIAAKIVRQPENDDKNQTEAERLGRLAGFSAVGRGETGMFAEARRWHRDSAIYWDVKSEIDAGVKRDFAYSNVAKKHDVSRSTVTRAYRKFKKQQCS